MSAGNYIDEVIKPLKSPCGANVHECKPFEAIADEGILTALINSGLNLWGSRGAVSRAGEMGVGEISPYEAVFVRFSAFQRAGACAVIRSPWAIPDTETVAMRADGDRF